MASRWQRIVALREKVRKQAEAVLHLHQRELSDVEAALSQDRCPEMNSGAQLQAQEALREVLRRRESALSAEVEVRRTDLRDKAIATKQVEYLRENETLRETHSENRREQAALETWQQNRKRKVPQ